MNTNKKHYWFPAQKYGWGWGLPCCWQGWVAYGVWLALLYGGGIFIAPRSISSFVVYAIVLGIALFIALFIKGERPRWRWGKD